MRQTSQERLATQWPRAAGVFLAEGTRLEIEARDGAAAVMVARLTQVMQLASNPQSSPRDGSREPGCSKLAPGLRLIVSSDGARLDPPRVITSSLDLNGRRDGNAERLKRFRLGRGILFEQGRTITLYLEGPTSEEDLAMRVIQLALGLQLHIQKRGGVLLHGALAEKEGVGVIMAGPGESGKTTSSRRLPPPWQSLSDDATLVVRQGPDQYWAHPWPTWSNFLRGGKGGSWDVQRGVRLKGIFFIIKSDEDRADRIGRWEAVCLLEESAEQASTLGERLIHGCDQREQRLERFNNVCGVGRTVPCYMLRQRLDGEFWREIERVLG